MIMKRFSSILAAALLAPVAAMACTGLIAGRNATVDGSVMITYSADSHGLYGSLTSSPAADWEEGAVREIIDWDSGKPLGSIPQVPHTYAVIGNMNEHALAITESTWGGRPELENPEGIIDYGTLIQLGLERARTAREAIKVMTDLVAEYGYYSSGESFSIADKNEAWVLELIGKGPGRKGAVWVAIRIPDDCISGHANQARIHTFPLNDKENCIYSEDVISFAREMGYYKGKDKNFSFSSAYAPLDYGALRGCDARVWSFFNRFNSKMGKYLKYLENEGGEVMPLYVRPDRKLTLDDMKDAMRDHFDGTPYDMHTDVGGGPFGSPYRFRPMYFEVDGVEYCNERATATQQTAFWLVGQARPGKIGVLWFGTDDAATSPLTPIYVNSLEVPECLRDGNGSMLEYSDTSMFWITNRVAQFAYLRYNIIGKKVREEVDAWENEMIKRVETADAMIASMPAQEVAQFATEFSVMYASRLFAKWANLDKYLMVKYIDGNVKGEDENGFITNGNGPGLPGKIEQPGYTEAWKRAVAKDKGEILRVVK